MSKKKQKQQDQRQYQCSYCRLMTTGDEMDELSDEEVAAQEAEEDRPDDVWVPARHRKWSEIRAEMDELSDEEVARSMADALRTLTTAIEFHEKRGRLVGDLTYTIRNMLTEGVVPEPYDDILRRHLARIDG